MRFSGRLLFLLIVLFCAQRTALAQGEYEPIRFQVTQFTISGDNPIGDRAQQVLLPFLGEQSGLEGLSAAADTLEQAIIAEGYSFHRVSLPPQQLTSGSVEFRVIQFGIGAIKIEGNQFFDEQNILHSLPLLTPGSSPNTKELSRSLKLANNHASKNVLLRFKEGEQADTIDAELTVKDRNPQLFFVTLDNTGSADSEEIRTTLGFQHGNLFNLDHALTATLTVSPEDVEATTQVGVNYHVPLYSHGANLDFLFSDSEVNTGSVGSDVQVNGKGSVLGFSYSRPLLTDSNFDQQWSAGFQYKIFDNSIETGSITTDADVDSFPLQLGYGFSRSTRNAVIAGGAELLVNTGVGGNNTDEAYEQAKTNADTGWSSVKYHLSYDQVFKESWLFHAGFSGQSSNDLLISGEQFGVGGSSTLRGFEERSVTGDSGYQASLEVWTPAYRDARLLAFFDTASVKLNDDVMITVDGVSEVVNSFDLSSAGIGVRWSWQQQLSVSLDVATIIKGGGPDTTINQDGDNKAHFNLIYRF